MHQRAQMQISRSMYRNVVICQMSRINYILIHLNDRNFFHSNFVSLSVLKKWNFYRYSKFTYKIYSSMLHDIDLPLFVLNKALYNTMQMLQENHLCNFCMEIADCTKIVQV